MLYIGEKRVDGFFSKGGLHKFFEKQIVAIGELPLDQQISLKDLKDTTKARTYIQFAYRESERRKLELGIVEFICWLSTDYIAGKICKSPDSLAEIPNAIEALFVSDPFDVKNMLRLFHSKEQFLFDALGVINYKDRKYLFAEISKIWYEIKFIERKS